MLVVGLYTMYKMIGLTFIAGVIVVILTAGINWFIGRLYNNYQKKIMKSKDVRMKATNELLNGIRLIKMNAWETYFKDKVDDTRKIELTYILK